MFPYSFAVFLWCWVAPTCGIVHYIWCVKKSLWNITECHTLSYNIIRLHLMAPMDFWWNSTPFLVQHLSVWNKLGILEDNLKNADEPAASTHSAPLSSVRPFSVSFSYKFNSLIFGWIFCHVDVVIAGSATHEDTS